MLSGIKFIPKDKRKEDLSSKQKIKIIAKSFETVEEDAGVFDMIDVVADEGKFNHSSSFVQENGKAEHGTFDIKRTGPVSGQTNRSAAEALRNKLKTVTTSPEEESPEDLISDETRRNLLVSRHLDKIRGQLTSGRGTLSIAELATLEKFSASNHDNDAELLDILSARSAKRSAAISGDDEEDPLVSKKKKNKRFLESTGSDSEGEADVRGKKSSGSDKHEKRSNDSSKHKLAAAEVQKAKKASHCGVCASVARAGQSLLVTQSSAFLLRLKESRLSLGEGHCELVSRSHEQSTVALDDQAAAELDRFVGCLRRMFERRDQLCLVVESAVGAHCVVDVIPIRADVLPDVIMGFREVRGFILLLLSRLG